MLRIRLSRQGTRNRPFYKIGVYDSRTRRDGKCIEKLGTYDPLAKDESKQFVLNLEEYKCWMIKGAQHSEGFSKLFKHFKPLKEK